MNATAQSVMTNANAKKGMDWAISIQATKELVEGSTTSAWSPGRTVKRHDNPACLARRYSLSFGETQRSWDKEPNDNNVDFGQVNIVPNRFQRDRSAFVLDPEYASVNYLRDFEVVDLARVGDSEQKLVQVEYGLEISNEAAHGVIADIDVTA